MKYILGLDVSTSCTGWCVLGLGDDGSVHVEKMGYIPLQKIKSFSEKATITRTALKDIKSTYKINNIFIEENLQVFRSGFSSAKTLVTLARFNGVVSFLSWETFNLDPQFMNVNAARKSVGLKIIRKSQGGDPTKTQVYNWVDSQLEPGYQWPMKTLKGGPKRGEVRLDPVSYDMADAYVVARAGCLVV